MTGHDRDRCKPCCRHALEKGCLLQGAAPAGQTKPNYTKVAAGSYVTREKCFETCCGDGDCNVAFMYLKKKQDETEELTCYNVRRCLQGGAGGLAAGFG